MWFGLQRALFNYPNDVPHPPPAVVPKAIENLVGTLGNKIKGSPGIVHEDGWLALLEACVLSQDFTATLFQVKTEGLIFTFLQTMLTIFCRQLLLGKGQVDV